MFYQKLKKLKNYNVPDNLIKKLEEIIPQISNERVSPILIAKKLNISEDLAFKICLFLVKESLASIKYEITCPECFSDVLIVDNIRDVPNNEITCDVCSKLFTPSEDDIWIVFDIFYKEVYKQACKVNGVSKVEPTSNGLSLKKHLNYQILST